MHFFPSLPLPSGNSALGGLRVGVKPAPEWMPSPGSRAVGLLRSLARQGCAGRARWLRPPTSGGGQPGSPPVPPGEKMPWGPGEGAAYLGAPLRRVLHHRLAKAVIHVGRHRASPASRRRRLPGLCCCCCCYRRPGRGWGKAGRGLALRAARPERWKRRWEAARRGSTAGSAAPPPGAGGGGGRAPPVAPATTAQLSLSDRLYGSRRPAPPHPPGFRRRLSPLLLPPSPPPIRADRGLRARLGDWEVAGSGRWSGGWAGRGGGRWRGRSCPSPRQPWLSLQASREVVRVVLTPKKNWAAVAVVPRDTHLHSLGAEYHEYWRCAGWKWKKKRLDLLDLVTPCFGEATCCHFSEE